MLQIRIKLVFAESDGENDKMGFSSYSKLRINVHIKFQLGSFRIAPEDVLQKDGDPSRFL